MSAVLRLYGPEECDHETFVVGKGPRPLDWDRCRTCVGSGAGPCRHPEGEHACAGDCGGGNRSCQTCAGHGSLKAAALAGAHRAFYRRLRDQENHNAGEWERIRREDAERALRCEGCGHPMSDGTWEGPDADDWQMKKGDAEHVVACLRRGREATEGELGSVHWSLCDEGCRHGAPIRMGVEGVEGTVNLRTGNASGPKPMGRQTLVEADGTAGEWAARIDPRFGPVEASWRQVDVRTLGWSFDLRPESLAVLCTRCWAARS